METTLPSANNKLLSNFLEISNKGQLASFLEIKEKDLIYYAFRLVDRYEYFQTEKKTGGLREISKPLGSLNLIQKKLNKVFQIAYNTKPPVHGFVKNRSIKTNAYPHVNKKVILNIDLNDFFPSINFGRVRGVFMNYPFNFNNEVAVILARLCTDNNSLPQGASTSPVLSNFVCRNLDSNLTALSKKYNANYSRYADDITFSFTTKHVPINLCEINFSDGNVNYTLGAELLAVINNNGFDINVNKVRIRNRYQRQEVTGITVNTKININRKFIRSVRGMLHSWKKFGIENANLVYVNEYAYKTRNPYYNPISYQRVVGGKLSYLKSILGEKSRVYRKLANQYFELINRPDLLYFLDPDAEISSGLAVLQTDNNNGTAFLLEDLGIITCQHVLEENSNAAELFRTIKHGEKHSFKVIKKDAEIDIAVIESDITGLKPFKRGDFSKLDKGSMVIIAGFPDYHDGDPAFINTAKVMGRVKRFGMEILRLDKGIIAGMSGGPVLNEDLEVIGIAQYGAANIDEQDKSPLFGVIPIDTIERI